MSRDEVSCIELVFTRGPSTSRRLKAKDLWTFLDSRSDIKPYFPPRPAPEIVSSKNSSGSTSGKSASLETSETQQTHDYPWYEGLCILRHLGLDKVALAAKDAGGDYEQPLNERNVTQENGHLADAVEEIYEDINSELQAFEERVKNNGAVKRRVYGVPEKYCRFVDSVYASST